MQNYPINLSHYRETPFNLQYLFAGKIFQWQTVKTFANGITNYQFKTSTGSQITHLTNFAMMTASTGFTVTLNEKGVKTDGTLTTTGISNANFGSNNIQQTQIRVSPTTSTGGASLTTPIKLSTFKLFSNSATALLAPEFILKQNTSYLMVVSNSGAGGQKINFDFVWYESNN